MMKLLQFITYYFLIFLCCVLSTTQLKAQGNEGKLKLEIVNPNIGIYAGPYRGRTAETDGFFNQGFTGFGQVYFPFQIAVDYRNKFLDTATISNEYNNRIFLLRPSALFQVSDNGSYALGPAIQFSWLIIKDYYLEYQLAFVYLEATQAAAPNLYSGFNLHHFVSVSKPVSKHFSLSIGYVHLSGAGLGNGTVSNQDVLALGVKCNF